MMRPTPFTDVFSLVDAVTEAAIPRVRVVRSGSAQSDTARAATWGMPVDCYTTDDHAVVLAAMPGVHPDDINVSVHKDVLSITGSVSSDRKQHDKDGAPVTWYLSEIQRGQYERRIKLPFAVEEDGVEAQFSNGLLRIELPKVEAAKPRRIHVRLLDTPLQEISAETFESSADEDYSAD